MKILLIGSNGQLGQDLKKLLSVKDLIPLTHQDVEISDEKNVREIFEKYKPKIVINTASYNKVEEAEKNSQEAFLVNATGVKNLAILCREFDATLVHFSSDYVFSGEKQTPYREDDKPNPLNIYGISKLAGEYIIKYTLKKFFLVRTSSLFGISGSRQKGGNFVEIMLRKAKNAEEIKVVDDIFFSPTYTYDLAECISDLISTDLYGVYHITNSGSCSWYEFAETIFKLTNIKANLKRISSNELETKVLRPKYSVLGNYKLASIGLPPLRHWREALETYLKERKQ
jgi:dTDP-4-dehydrorhamnose reductase